MMGRWSPKDCRETAEVHHTGSNGSAKPNDWASLHPLIKQFVQNARRKAAATYAGERFAVGTWEHAKRVEIRVDPPKKKATKKRTPHRTGWPSRRRGRACLKMQTLSC